MYLYRLRRLSVWWWCTPSRALRRSLAAKAGVPQTAMRYTSEEQVAAFYWVDDKVAYVVSGPADREQLEIGDEIGLRTDRQERGEEVVMARQSRPSRGS